jgi:predicted methyltransferase
LPAPPAFVRIPNDLKPLVVRNRPPGRHAMSNLRFDETRVLRHALNTTDIWRIAGSVRLEFPRFLRALKSLEKKGLVATGKGTVRLTRRGRTEARSCKLRSRREVAGRIRKARKIFADLARRRPGSRGAYNQGYMTPDSVFNRVGLIAEMGDVDARAVAILGDDDLLSIALCLAAGPEKVTVFEIDAGIVDFIRRTAARLDLPIEAECRDLREPLPAKLGGRFDTFITDPSETIEGLKMFLGRGLELLKPKEGRAGYFGLTSIEASAGKWHGIQRWMLTRYPLAITHILPENAFYRNWPDLPAQTRVFSLKCLESPPKRTWFNSSLVRLETLSDFKPRRIGRVTGAIFNDEEACGSIDGGAG